MGLGDDFGRELAFWDGVDFCDLVQRILVESRGQKWADAEARVAEHYPALDNYQALLQTKRLLILQHPEGGELVWRRFVSVLDYDYKPQIRD